jgi:PadR family transcriptional regulator PadR
LHGYAIAREVSRRSGDALQCKQGTLYPILFALEHDGLIQGAWEHEEGKRPKKVYALTQAGEEELVRRVRSWRKFNDAVERVIGEGGPDVQPA